MKLRLPVSLIAGILVLPGLTLPASAAPPVAYNVTLLGQIDTYEFVSDCWGYTSPGGTELAIYGHLDGTSFVDCTDPSNPVEIWNLPGPTATARDIKTYQDHAYIVCGSTGAGIGLQIVDLSNPLAPVHVSTYTGSGFTSAHNLWIDTGAGFAYAVSAGGGMRVLSLADPEAPVEVDFFTDYVIHDIWVGGGRGYASALSAGGLHVLDTTDPSNVFTTASHFYPGAATHNAWPNDAGTHVLTTDEITGGHLKIWNVSGLPNVNLSSEYIASGDSVSIIHNVLVKDDIAYIAYYSAGLRVVDVSDPVRPAEVGWYDTYPGAQSGFFGAWGAYPFRSDDVVYVSDIQSGLWVLRFDGDYAGTIQGTVLDASTGGKVPYAEIVPVGGPATLFADNKALYDGRLSGGTYTLITTHFGYDPDTSVVVVPPGGSVTHDIQMQPAPTGTVQVQATGERSGQPLVGAVVVATDTPLPAVVTDASGTASLALPAGISWNVRVVPEFGLAVVDVPVVPVAGQSTPVPVVAPPGFSDDFDYDRGWYAGAPDDDATDGLWERAIPVGSFYGGPVGVNVDASGDSTGYAWVTENHVAAQYVGFSDVDDGKTTLLSPVFDASGLGALKLRYQRWFSNRAPAPSDGDPFLVDISTDGGATWTNVETLTVGTDAWALVETDLTALVPATATMQLRFVAEDLGSNHFVEGGVDEVEILAPATAAVAPGEGAPRSALELSAPAPNPFRGGTSVSFRIARDGPVRVAVYDVAGRRVSTLVQGDRIAAGEHRVRWSGTDADGRDVAPGVYFAVVRAAGQTGAVKLVLRR